MSKRLLIIAALLLATFILATYFDIDDRLAARMVETAPVSFSDVDQQPVVTEVTAGLTAPWGMVFTAPNRILITERRGTVRTVRDGQLTSEPLLIISDLAHRADGFEGGLLDITLHPDYATNRWVYLAYTTRIDEYNNTLVARYVDVDSALVDETIIFPGVEGTSRGNHFGCRLLFGPDGKLYVTLGERGEKERSQDLMDLNGKTLRLNDDGSIPDDNPFVDRDDAHPAIYTYGNRNSQGLAFEPGSGRLWSTDHGPSWYDAPGGGDEVNIYVAGGNYGWPIIHHRETREGLISPVAEYTPAVAPSGCAFIDSEIWPESWRGDLLIACLAGQCLIRLDLEDGNISRQMRLLDRAHGRLRHVAQGPDGAMYVLTSDTDAYGPGRDNGDQLLRLTPPS